MSINPARLIKVQFNQFFGPRNQAARKKQAQHKKNSGGYPRNKVRDAPSSSTELKRDEASHNCRNSNKTQQNPQAKEKP